MDTWSLKVILKVVGLLTCVFKVNCFNKKVLLKVLVKVWHTFGVHLLVLVLPILFS